MRILLILVLFVTVCCSKLLLFLQLHSYGERRGHLCVFMPVHTACSWLLHNAQHYWGGGLEAPFSPYEISAVKEFSLASQLASAYIIEEVTSICYQLELGK